MSPNFKSLLRTNFEDLIIFDDLQFNGGFFLSNFGTKNDIFFFVFLRFQENQLTHRSLPYMKKKVRTLPVDGYIAQHCAMNRKSVIAS